jgi:hypothetical protein
LCTKAAATAESTPPDSPQMTSLSPTWARIAATCSSMMFALVHVGAMPAMSYRNRDSMACPPSVCATSGWNWTPASPRLGSSNAATGAPDEPPVTANPCGARETQSPWLIHTSCSAGIPLNSTLSGSRRTGVPPNSRAPVCVTSPPSARAIAWNP